MFIAKPHWCSLLTDLALLAFSLALASAGKSMPAKIPMMAITTRSSMSVKARLVLRNQLTIIFRISMISFGPLRTPHPGPKSSLLVPFSSQRLLNILANDARKKCASFANN
jgi:hypothetical protein